MPTNMRLQFINVESRMAEDIDMQDVTACNELWYITCTQKQNLWIKGLH